MIFLFEQVAANNGLDGVLTLQATPSVFYNECEILFKLEWKGGGPLPSDVNIQVQCTSVVHAYNCTFNYMMYIYTSS